MISESLLSHVEEIANYLERDGLKMKALTLRELLKELRAQPSRVAPAPDVALQSFRHAIHGMAVLLDRTPLQSLEFVKQGLRALVAQIDAAAAPPDEKPADEQRGRERGGSWSSWRRQGD